MDWIGLGWGPGPRGPLHFSIGGTPIRGLPFYLLQAAACRPGGVPAQEEEEEEEEEEDEEDNDDPYPQR